ncbi:MAG: ABC transporter permease subunit [Vicinamibacterales bacterium]|nr:ABC transporter permease subunit [Vicinamibacterales bacterium]
MSPLLTLYRFEVRSALRERSIVINSILLPILLYPGLMWLMFTGISFVRGQTDDMASRIVVSGPLEAHAPLDRALRQDRRFQIVDPAGEDAAALRAGALDARLELSVHPVAALPGNLQALVVYDGSHERSSAARQRLVEVLEQYRDLQIRTETLARGVAARDWAGFLVEGRNVASERDMGGFLLGLMLPLMFVVMVAVGCFYPAIDTTAGERERGTWETLMTTSASRTSIVVAKYLYVATFGCVAGLLNVAAMALTMRTIVGQLAGGAVALDFSVRPEALPVLAAGAVLLSAFIAAGMMVFASFARTFREGQSMITPFYLLVLLPTVFLSSRGTAFSPALAAIPVVNVALVIRDALSGVFQWPLIGITVAVTLAAIAGLLRLAAAIVAAEAVVAGSYSGTLATFVRGLFGRAAPAPKETAR